MATTKVERDYDELLETYGDMYESNICKERQLPDYKDGMRIIQRRMFWVFLKMSKESRYRLSKSASIVGDVMKLHPHGDCKIGTTNALLANGETKTFKELYESECDSFDVWSYDKEKGYITSKAHSFRIGQMSSKNIRIHTSTGGIYEITFNDPLMLNNNEYLKAEELKVGHLLKSTTYLKSGSLVGEVDKSVNAMHINHIVKIEIVEYDEPIPMYDFTVDKYENMLIGCLDQDDNMSLIVAHNSSIYGSLVAEVNSVANLFRGKGNWGCKFSSIKSKPAAMRYTECAMQKESENYFQYSKFAKEILGEVGFKEAEDIPVPFPYALISGFFGITKSGRCQIPSYKASDLCKRLLYKLGITKDNPIIKPYFGEEFKMSGEFEKILISGKGAIEVFPNMIIQHKKEEIIVKGVCPNITTLGSILEKMSIDPKYGKYIIVKDLSSKNTEIRITFNTKYMKNVNISFKKLCEFVKKKLTAKITYNIMAYKGYKDYPVVSVDTWLIDNFNRILSYREVELLSLIEIEMNKLNLNNAIIKIRPKVQEYLHRNKTFTKAIINKLKGEVLHILGDKELTSKVMQITVTKLLDADIDTNVIEKEIKRLTSLNVDKKRNTYILDWLKSM